MKDYLAPAVATVIAGIIFALSGLFGTVSNNTKDIEKVEADITKQEIDIEKKMVLYRGFILENRDRVTVLETKKECEK